VSKDIEAIDFHVHLPDYIAFTDSAYKWFAQRFSSKEAYQQFSAKYQDPINFCNLLKETGITYAVILAEVAPLTTGIVTNETVEEFCKGKDELIPFCTLNPNVNSEIGVSLEALCIKRGFKGVKLYPTYNHFYPNDYRLYPLYDTAQRLNIPVLFHTGSSIFKNSRIKYGNPILLDDVAVDFPELKIIMAHGGRGAWYDEAMLMARLHPHIYIEVSGLPPKKLLDYYPDMDRFADKFIFGTDWPGVDAKKNIDDLKRLNISEDAKAKILSRNAKKLLNLKV
jgi:predicted TIM-barrel fold metal-dependent hydrolase